MDFPDPVIEDSGPKMGSPFPPLTVLLLLLITIMLCSLIGIGLVYGLSTIKGVNISEIQHFLSEESPLGDRNFIRTANLISHLLSFSLPALLLVVFLYRKNWLTFLRMEKIPAASNIFWGTLFILCSFPLAQFALWLNRQLPLPDWATQIESSAEEMIMGLMVMESPVELLFNLLVVAVVPAIGEELIFRGILQQKLQEQFQRPLLAIWLSAIIFSAIHFQFEGFFARMILGAVLGYLFYWTRNLWVPIIAHFFINGIQVVTQYFFGEELKELEMETMDTASWLTALLSLFLVLGLGYFLKKKNLDFSTPKYT